MEEDVDQEIEILEEIEDDSGFNGHLGSPKTSYTTTHELVTDSQKKIPNQESIVYSLEKWENPLTSFTSPDCLKELDAQSRSLIESMLAEEEYYFGSKSNKFGTEESDDERTEASKRTNRLAISASSCNMPSHNTRWDEDETTKLMEGIEKFGLGKWIEIADYIGTRNPLQVKNRARHVLYYKKSSEHRKIDEKDNLVTATMGFEEAVQPSQGVSNHFKPETLDQPKVHMESIKFDSEASKGVIEPINTDSFGDVTKEKDTTAPSRVAPTNDDIVLDDETSDKISTTNSLELNWPALQELKDNQGDFDSGELSRRDDDSDYFEEEEEFHYPLEQREIDLTLITEDEMLHNSEFFSIHSPKTPQRYMRIRNYIIQSWNKQRPKYLSKTTSRKGLKDCGDVNAIGRVHDYLEQIGAINVGCDQDRIRLKKRVLSKRRHLDDQSKDPSDSLSIQPAPGLLSDVSVDGRRRRRVRNELGEWVDEGELGGRTFTHLTQEEILELNEAQRLAEINSTYFKDEQGVSHGRKRKIPTGYDFYNDVPLRYDPFMLVPPKRRSKLESDFQVTIQAKALVMMDLHSHLAETEVIGLLGGHFDDQTHIVEIIEAFPCNSISTGFQCEMDPVSELEARNQFKIKNLVVVGWYHSHPCFEPDPSIRDIENQTQYQALFHQESGFEPFVGVIIMPYDPNKLQNESRIEIFHVSKEWNAAHTSYIPYLCEHTILPATELSEALLNHMLDLVLRYFHYEHRIDLSRPFRSGDSMIRLEKLVKSMRSHLSILNASLDRNTETQFFQKLQESIIKLTFPAEIQSSHLQNLLKSAEDR